jgi:hypothetical protein
MLTPTDPEEALVRWLRGAGPRFGTLEVRLVVSYQDGRMVAAEVYRIAEAVSLRRPEDVSAID